MQVQFATSRSEFYDVRMWHDGEVHATRQSRARFAIMHTWRASRALSAWRCWESQGQEPSQLQSGRLAVPSAV